VLSTRRAHVLSARPCHGEGCAFGTRFYSSHSRICKLSFDLCAVASDDLIFGDTDELKQLNTAAVSPLNGARQIALSEPADDGAPRSYEYFIKVVPTKYEKLSGAKFDSYQFVSNSNVIVGRFNLPAIYFRYDFSPISVLFQEQKSSLAHFLVQGMRTAHAGARSAAIAEHDRRCLTAFMSLLASASPRAVCAIVGGLFTVLGLFNGMALAAGKKFKLDLNKLG
jgi:hypothetical protein